MKRMLFNATQQEELRVAIVDGQKLIDIDIETTGREQRKSNIYKGVITRIEPSLEACFVSYGEERHGFLPFKEVARSYFREGVDVRTASIKDALREGQEIMVQVEKEERGNKGAALTSFVSLAGRYLVLMPNNPRGGGVSRRVEGEDRQELRETMDKLDLPTGMSVIARTAGIGRNVDELQWDLNYLMQLWRAIEGAGKSAPGAFLIYQESSLVIRAIRDYFQPDIGEILIDTDDIYEQAQQFMSHVMPDMVHRVKRYRDDVPLFSRFQIEHQIETAYSRTVPLPSGGAIVIDHTEALVSVDVNSARATRGSDIETTAFHTNLEAAEEVARQLRLRDLGGLIVIDFIDMENAKNQREVETRLKDALHFDRARVQMGKISRFGLMELSRQRLRPSLSDGSHVACPRCNGTGHIRDIESSALQVLRIIQEEAMKENSAAIHVQAPVDVAAFLLNEKRGEILKIETRHRVSVILIPNKHLETPHYKLERIKHDDPRLDDSQASYMMSEQADTNISYGQSEKEEAKPRQEAMVKGITPDQPAPIVERKPIAVAPASIQPSEEGFLSRLFGLFRKKPVAPAPAPVVEKPLQSRERTERGNSRNPRGRQRSRNGKDRPDDREATRPDTRQEGPKPAQSELAVAQAARQQRQPKEAREPREANENRRERQPRPARDERKEPAAVKGDAKNELETVLALQDVAAFNSSAIPQPVITAVTEIPLAENEADAAAGPEGGEGNDEQRRRRRRRGGRNRNRRERENGSASESGDDTDATESNAEAMEGIGADSDVVATRVEITAVHAAVAATEIPVVVAQVTSFAESIPSAPNQYASGQEDGGFLTTSAPAPEALAAEAQATETGSEFPSNENPTAVSEAAPEAISQPEPESPQISIAAEPVPSPISAPAAPRAPSPQASEAEGKSVRLEDFQEILSSAGLTLAATNPEKLKAAQEAAANAPVSPRIPRERKAVLPTADAPLIQVETHR
jgi:ribonuclease E